MKTNYELRYAAHPEDARSYDTQRLRRDFLIEKVFSADEVNMVYSMYDRMIVGGAMPVNESVHLEAIDPLKQPVFLRNRELGIFNVGGKGRVRVGETVFALDYKEALYLGSGDREVYFESEDAATPAKFYFNSAPAHRPCPSRLVTIDQAKHVEMGSAAECNKRVINQFIHPAVLETCQLVMGMTIFSEGSVWNTMPVHTHERRMEVYLYFDMPKDRLVFHLMGRPGETRHIVVRNEEAVISPSWSIHAGVGTGAYTFIWGMAGENQTFTDMDAVSMDALN